jgi:predicted nucleotidyltransferase
MEKDTSKSDVRKFTELFDRHAVEFILIGGQAETLMGSPRVTYDVDLCYRRTGVNLERLAGALKELKPKLRGVPDDVPLLLDPRALALGNNYTFDTPLGKLDLLGWVEPIGDYDALLKRAEQYPLANLKVNVIALDDLILVKEHICRAKDAESLFQLRAIKTVRAGGTRP